MIVGIDASNLRAGGGLTHLWGLLEAADPAADAFDGVVVWVGPRAAATLPARPWLTVVEEPMLDGALPRRLVWQRTVLRARLSGACDLLFAPGGGAGGAGRGRHIPRVVMCRNMLPFETGELRRYGVSPMALRLLLLRRAQRRVLARADGVIFLTEYAQATAMRTIRRLAGRSAIIPHGVNARFRKPPRPQRPLAAYSADRPFRLLYVSIIDLYKQQWHVAEAVARLRAAGWPVALDLVGPAYAPALRRLEATLRRLDPDGRVIRHRDMIPHTELPAVYHDADAFVFASSCENMPNVLLEAMSAGLPIASSRRGPMPEILRTAGVYFDPEQPLEIAATLGRLIEDAGLRAELAARAYARAGHYSWARCARETFAFLADVLRASRPGRAPAPAA
jgi:glycosyltransferase involved in cell wall biosynthesis